MNVEEVTGAVEMLLNRTKDLSGNLAGILREIAFARISNTRDAGNFTWKICRRRLTADHQQGGIIFEGLYLMAQNGCNAAWPEMIMYKNNFHATGLDKKVTYGLYAGTGGHS
jgi:hypothetical protein